MLCKDNPEYRLHISIEAGPLNWKFLGIYVSRRLDDELSSAVIYSEIMPRTPGPVHGIVSAEE